MMSLKESVALTVVAVAEEVVVDVVEVEKDAVAVEKDAEEKAPVMDVALTDLKASVLMAAHISINEAELLA